MCGIIAAFGGVPITEDAADRALARLARRGPDAEGRWRDDASGVFLGHRRLAILDLDTRSTQPMHSACGRYLIVFNGEIYNFRALRTDLESRGVRFRTTSDTEVILAMFAEHGEAMLPKLRGMFAFVIWDRVAKRAFAARDPYGIKPLYVASVLGGTILASQVKALLATGLVSREPDTHGQVGFWMLGSVPEPHTWFRDISMLPAGHCAWIEGGRVVATRCWHDIGDHWRAAPPPAGPSPQDTDAVQEQVAAALRQSVESHLVADVPVGVFLSGGVDSGALAGLMVDAGCSNLHGVTIAYEEYSGTGDDEQPAAALTANHYGIHHHVRRVGQTEFLADLPRILDAMDQPSVDGINTWYASKAVAELGLRVVVSGVGGDELFLGYSLFEELPKLMRVWKVLTQTAGSGRTPALGSRLLGTTSDDARWRHAPDWLRSIGGAWWLRRCVMAPDDLPEHVRDASSQLLSEFDAAAWVHAMAGNLPTDPTLALAQIESKAYVRNQLLRDSDWASMDHGVELRTPLVDAHLLRELAPMLPQFPKFSGKRLLARAPGRPIPAAVQDKPKTGFSIPVSRWLRASGAVPRGAVPQQHIAFIAGQWERSTMLA
jgi:asparagine synthase (glutamine-hydrolysing)